jgi:hypothetical protein
MNDPRLPDRQEFRSHQRAAFNAALLAAANEGGFVIDVLQVGAETVSVIRREAAPNAEQP